jgi:hypothetical protein
MVRIAGLAVLHFLALKFADLVLFLFTHLPPAAIQIDGLIRIALIPYRILLFPRPQIRQLWPGESTPSWLNIACAIAASVLWGIALAALLAARRKIRSR